MNLPWNAKIFHVICNYMLQHSTSSSVFITVQISWLVNFVNTEIKLKKAIIDINSITLTANKKKRVAYAGRESDLPPSLPISWPNDDVAASLILMCSMSRNANISELFINIFNFFEVCNWAKHFLLLYTKSFFIVKINHQNIKQ